MESALVIATAVVPLYTGLLHGWIYIQRQREPMHLWLAVVALALAGIASALIGHGNAAGAEEARFWQTVQLGAGAPLLVGFVRFTAAFVGVRRPRIEALAWGVVALVAAGIAGDRLFAHEVLLRPVLPFHPPAPEAPLTRYGELVLGGFVFFVAWCGFELVRSGRERRDVRSLVAGYAVFAATLLHDAARAAGWVMGPELITFGYLVLVVGTSALLVQRFVRSMEEADRLAVALHDHVEARSAELRRKEVQLIHGERLATLGTLAAGVAHEINDPMAFVSSNLNRLEECWADPAAEEEVREILRECREGVTRLRGTVAELLRLARGSDARDLPVDLAAVVSSVLPLLRSEARDRAELTYRLDPVPPVSGNPGLLAQVALQVVLGAVRAGPAGSGRRHRVHVVVEHGGGRVHLRVRDDGPPFPAELVPTLFDPFAVAEEPPDLERSRGGARLGLAVTHQIVRAHGGEIALEQDARGTEVRVSLPVAEASGDQGIASQARRSAASGSHTTALVRSNRIVQRAGIS